MPKRYPTKFGNIVEATLDSLIEIGGSAIATGAIAATIFWAILGWNWWVLFLPIAIGGVLFAIAMGIHDGAGKQTGPPRYTGSSNYLWMPNNHPQGSQEWYLNEMMNEQAKQAYEQRRHRD